MVRLWCGVLALVLSACGSGQALPTVAVLPSETPMAAFVRVTQPLFIAETEAARETADAFGTMVAESATSTLTPSPRPPTATPSLERQARAIAEDVIIGDVISVEDNTFVPSLVIVFEMPQDFSGYNVDYTGDTMLELACELREIAPTYRLLFTAQIETIDRLGNEGTAQGLNVLLMPELMQQVNCENAILLDVRDLAETYDLSPLLQ